MGRRPSLSARTWLVRLSILFHETSLKPMSSPITKIMLNSDAVESWLYPAFPDLTRLAIAADDDVPRVSRRGSLEEPMDTAE